jgi:hypothetical protein
MTSFITQDGTVLLLYPKIGVVSPMSRVEAEAEIRRRHDALPASRGSAA